MKKSVDVTYSQSGFTLIELMIALVVMAIIAAIAYPNYTQYMERRDLAIARQEALRIAAELERFKAKNFSYKGFDASYVYAYQEDNGSGTMVAKSYYDPATGKLNLPVGATGTAVKYTITLVDGGSGYKPLTIAKNNDGTETSDSASVKGLKWAMKVERAVGANTLPKQPSNYDLLLTSEGVRCMTKTSDVVKNYTDCGTTDVEKW
jgi:type IV pilus assembly protein PilE